MPRLALPSATFGAAVTRFSSDCLAAPRIEDTKDAVHVADADEPGLHQRKHAILPQKVRELEGGLTPRGLTTSREMPPSLAFTSYRAAHLCCAKAQSESDRRTELRKGLRSSHSKKVSLPLRSPLSCPLCAGAHTRDTLLTLDRHGILRLLCHPF